MAQTGHSFLGPVDSAVDGAVDSAVDSAQDSAVLLVTAHPSRMRALIRRAFRGHSTAIGWRIANFDVMGIAFSAMICMPLRIRTCNIRGVVWCKIPAASGRSHQHPYLQVQFSYSRGATGRRGRPAPIYPAPMYQFIESCSDLKSSVASRDG